MNKAVSQVAVLGAGSWGTALAMLLARNGHDACLWGRDQAQMQAIALRHENPRYLPGIPLPGNLRATDVMADAIAGAHWLLVAVPSHAFADTLRMLATLRPSVAGIAWASKGFEPGSGRFLHEVARDHVGEAVPLAVITGPSFAREVAQGLPTAVTVHGLDDVFATQVAEALHGPTFRAYTGNDMLGAELGGAMKNVLAVATGVADGMALGLNARAGLITRGLNEMLRLNVALGGRAETLIGLAGLGDLVLTCTGDLSRNRRVGLALAENKSLPQILEELGHVAEGVYTAREVDRLASQFAVDMPISAAVAAVLDGRLSAAQAVAELMARDPKEEAA